MKNASKRMKQFLTLTLAISMIVTTVPQTGMQVLAVGTDTVEETSITHETSGEDTVTESSDGTAEESGLDNREEEPPASEDENVGGGLTDDEADTNADTSDGNQDPSDSDTDGESSDEDIDGEEIPEDEEGDDSVSDETEDDESSETEDGVSDPAMNNKLYSAATTSADDEFTVDDSGKLTKYEGAGGDIIIPDGVVTIGSGVFQNNTTITNVTFPDTVKTIDSNAFSGCTSLWKVKLNEGLETIGNYAFNQAAFGSVESTGKINYGTIEIPGSVQKIGYDAFKGCKYLQEVTFSEENAAAILTFDTSFGSSSAFADCSALEKVVLPNRLAVLSSNLFNGDSKLKEVQLGNSVETIESNVFNQCTSLQGIDLPQTVKEIGDSAFAGCSSLEYANLNDGLVTIGRDAFYQAAFGRVESTGKITYGTLEIPGSVQTIGADAFKGCKYLKEVTFSEENAADILTFDTYFGTGSNFADCQELERVVLPNRLTVVINNLFNGDSKLKEVQLGNSVETIEASAFAQCTSLEGIELPQTLKEIGNYAFNQAAFGNVESTGKINYGTIEIPGSVQKIGYDAFKGCKYLKEVTFSEENAAAILTFDTSFGSSSAFADCQELERVVLPNRLAVLSSTLFNGDSKLKEVQLGNSVETIESNVFNQCTSLQGIDLPQTVKEIGDSAFAGCSSLEYANLNEGLVTIGKSAFDQAAFGNVESTGKINYGSLEIPGSVQTIGAQAFKGCKYLKEVTFIENGSSYILTFDTWFGSSSAFADCPALEKVVLPNRLTVLSSNLFNGDSKLKEVQLGNSVETIESNVFNQCTSLQGIDLPQTVKEIGDSAFAGCSSLVYANLNEGLVTIGNRTFSSTGISGTLIIPTTVQTIGSSAFAYSDYLEGVTFENGETVVLTIGSGAFSNCSKLKKVFLPVRLTTLDIGIVNNSKVLNTLYIPETVTTINGTYSQYSYSTKLVIYGVKGSKAEEFANKYGIPFKLKTELDIYAKGITLSPAKIVRALKDEDLSNVTVQLNAQVTPSSALNKAVTYESDNMGVAIVSDTGVVTLVGYGTATIKAIAVDKETGTFSAECKVSVLHQWTDEEKNAAREKLYELNRGDSSQFTLVTNIYINLQKDFPLNTGAEDFTAEWRLPYAVQPGTYSVYDVVLRKEGYEDTTLEGMTIKGIQVEGISIDGNSNISIKKDKPTRLTSRIAVKGYQNDEILQSLAAASELDYEINWKSAKTANVTVKVAEGTQGKEADLTGVKQSKGTVITAELVLKNKVSQTSATLTAQIKVDVLDVDVVDGIVISVTDSSNNPIEVSSLRDLEDIDIGTEYRLKAEASADGNSVNCSFTWSSSDAKVAQIKAQSDGSAVLTVKAAAGSATIFVTAAKNGGYSASFKMTLKDSTPRLENSNVTLNLNLEKPESIVTIRPSDGHLIQEDSLELVLASGGESPFTINKVPGSAIEYLIGVKDDKIASLATGKQKVTLRVETKAANDENTHKRELSLTIQVNKQTPKVTITQTAINLYEKDGTGTLEVVSNVPISSIQYTPNATGGVHLEQKSAELDEDSLKGSLSYGFAGGVKVDSTNYKTANAKGTLTVKFEGYKPGTEYSKTITLKTNKTLPKFTTAGITLYPDTNPVAANSAPVIITNKSIGDTVGGDADYTIELSGTQPEHYVITNQTEVSEWQPPTVTVSSGAKAKTLKFTIRNNNWFENITTTASCKVKIGKTPALSFSNAKVILNTKYTLDNYDPVEVKPYIAGFEDDIKITGLEEVKGRDANSKKVLDSGALQLKFEDGVIKAGITNAGAFSGTKKYTYQVTAKTSKGLSVTGTLTVTVTASAPSVALKASGSIDLADRQGSKSAVVYKISTKNFTDDIQSVELGGPYANCFNLAYENGAATVQAEEDRELKIKTKYQLSVKVIYESGAELIKEVTITPKQSSPKFTTDVKKATLFESAQGETYGQKIVFSGKTETPIEKIELVSGQNAFDYAYGEEDGSVILYVTEDAYAKTNKTYKLKFAITLKDSAVNASPIYVTVQVKYNK